ncbi:hypothetical protein [Mastigocoleus testarum]|uniref:Oligosaccharide repeat unit polymerase n=1 Tax=Mastigocoleus testarum BC008 TaxID=371196 RepID=A0A0V7ZFM9_9CYAN|nr:hypothetical protein [Mastigocoleus testarum]KST63323.1 hypothetical protein BC008_39255 [Mastigocoleus testarum BC008]
MVELFLYLFLAICLALLLWGLNRSDRIYQYPFLMGAIFVSFLLPQAFALINNPGVVSKLALERVLLMSCLCAAMCWLGYQHKINTRLLKKLYIPLNERRLFKAGIILTIIGYIFRILLLRTNIQVGENSNWTGPATIYIFFAQVVEIAFAIFMLAVVKKPKFANVTAAIIAGYPIFVSAFLEGRRQNTFTFLIIIGISLLYVRRLLPPKLVVMILIIIGIFIIPLVGMLREEFWLAIVSGNLQNINLQSGFAKIIEGEILELRNAAILIEAAVKNNQYGYGTGFWDRIIFQYVPGQIVGLDFKNSLQFNWTSFDLSSLFGYSIPRGSTVTGIGDSFLEFGYFGCLIFACIAYFFKHLWISSVYQRSIFSQILYAGLISPTLVGVTHGIGRFIQEAIFQFIFVSWVAYYSKIKDKSSTFLNHSHSEIIEE